MTISAEQIARLRQHPHKSTTYIALLKPEVLLTARLVEDNDRGATTVSINTIVGDTADILSGMTIHVYSTPPGQNPTYIGKARVRNITTPSGGVSTLTLAQNSLEWQQYFYIEIVKNFEYWPMYPRVVYNEETDVVTWYKDYDVAYSNQNLNINPIPIMGPPRCAFIDADTGVATAYFDGTASYCINGTVAAAEWTFEGGTPSTKNSAYVGNVTWDTPGTYLVSLKITAGSGAVTTGYRHVFIFDEDHMPLGSDDFTIDSARGSVSEGGWSWTVTVYGDDLNTQDYPEGTMVVLFGDTHCGSGDVLTRTGNRGVGWIESESVHLDVEQGFITFNVVGIQQLMKSSEAFSVAYDYTGDTPADWTQVKWMSSEMAMFLYMYWHSTLFTITDVFFPSRIRVCPNSYKVFGQDFMEGSLWDGVIKLAEECFWQVCANRESTLYIDNNPHLLPSSGSYENDFRLAMPVIMALSELDREGEFVLERKITGQCSQVDFQGVAFDGTTATAVLSLAPTEVPSYYGTIVQSLRHVLDPDDAQVRANELAGHEYAWRNNPTPNIRWTFCGDYSLFDLVPFECFTLTLDSEDAPNRLAWINKPLLPIEITDNYDFIAGTTQIEAILEELCEGTPGVEGIYPPTEFIPPPPPPPPPPDDDDDDVPIPPPVLRGTGKTVITVWWDDTNNRIYVLKCHNIFATSPTWVDITGNLPTTTEPPVECLRLDPFDPANKAIITNGRKLFRTTTLKAATPTWTEILDVDTLLENTPSNITHLHMSIESSGLIVAGAWATVGSYGTGYVIHSHDYGATWHKQVTPSGVTSYAVVSLDLDERPNIKHSNGAAIGKPFVYLGLSEVRFRRMERWEHQSDHTFDMVGDGIGAGATTGGAKPYGVHVPYNTEANADLFWYSYLCSFQETFHTLAAVCIMKNDTYYATKMNTNGPGHTGGYFNVHSQDQKKLIMIHHHANSTDQIVKVSFDSGTHWTTRSTPGWVTNGVGSTFPYDGGLVYLLGTNRVVLSRDFGTTWLEKAGNFTTLFSIVNGSPAIKGRCVVPIWTEDWY